MRRIRSTLILWKWRVFQKWKSSPISPKRDKFAASVKKFKKKDIIKVENTLDSKIVTRLKLPKGCYGPISCKILSKFRDFHGISSDEFPLPVSADKTEVALSKILDMMLYTLGEKNRNELIRDCDDYSMALHPAAIV